LFYMKGLLNGTSQSRKAIIKYLNAVWLSIVTGSFKKGEIHPIIQRLQELFGANIDRTERYIEDKNKDLALKFRPEPYVGDVILISARGKRGFRIYEDQQRNESIVKWGDLTTGKLYSHEVLEDHNEIMNKPGVKAVAQIINKHLFKD